MRKENMFQIITMFVVLLIITMGVSFAYFTATITGAETNTTITVSGGTMNITYSGGSAITVSNIYPQAAAWVTKNFTITGNNTTGVIMNYNMTFVVQTNTFSAPALKYKLTSTNTGANGTIIPSKLTNQNIATGASSILLGNGSFTGPTSGNKVHTYKLEIFFPDTGSPQNEDQNKQFTGYIKTEAGTK